MPDDRDKTDFAGEAAELKEQLVAYLDGELDEPTKQRIEARLAVDPGLREALSRLERTWDLLDDLDQANVDETFTQSTIQMVALAASDEIRLREEEAPRRRRRRWLVGGGSVAAAALAGYAAVALLWPNPNEQLLKDLPVLENLDHYSQIDDVEFLRLLAAENIFAGENGAGENGNEP